MALPDVVVVEHSGDGTALMQTWRGAQRVFIVDAVSSRSAPGTIRRFDARDETIPTRFFHYSTHAFSLAEGLELARVLGQLPPRLVVYGVEGRDWSPGGELSEPVARAALEVAEAIVEELTAAADR
jgi:hydrogenase maturation protease